MRPHRTRKLSFPVSARLYRSSLAPEEIKRFKELETRYIDDPTLADRIRETYRDIFEQRRAAACPKMGQESDSKPPEMVSEPN